MNRRVASVVAVWLCLVTGGVAALERYKAQPGPAAEAPAQWPAPSTLAHLDARPRLLVFAHPRCPCTRATLHELARLAAKLPAEVAVDVVFVRPEGTPIDWEQTSLWALARSIAGARVSVDQGGVEARRFGSSTSGQVLLYGRGGELQFAGGITLARGHEGDSPGAERVLALVRGSPAELAHAPVFGCPLHDPEASP